MNQVIIAYRVAANGTVSLNRELDEFRHVPYRNASNHRCGDTQGNQARPAMDELVSPV